MGGLSLPLISPGFLQGDFETRWREGVLSFVATTLLSFSISSVALCGLAVVHTARVSRTALAMSVVPQERPRLLGSG